jgi:hypothetical protein
MAQPWKHPQFGGFVHDGLAWVGKVQAPGFNVCSFVPGRSVTQPPDGTYELTFDADDDSEFPSQAMIQLIERFLSKQNELPLAIGAAVWKAFRAEDLAEGFEDEHLKPPTGPADLLRGLRLYQIAVRGEADGYSEPIIELSFWAAYDREHDLGVLTDGEMVRGIGGAADVVPFEDE